MTDNPSNIMPMQPIPNNIYPFDPNESLTSFLSRDSDGMSILNEFYCKKRLSVAMKNLLSRKIISREIDVLLRLKGFKCGDKVDTFEYVFMFFVCDFSLHDYYHSSQYKVL